MRFKPNTIVIHQAHDGNRDGEKPCGKYCESIEGAVSRCIQDFIAPDSGKPFR